jgi:hypothetical protein
MSDSNDGHDVKPERALEPTDDPERRKPVEGLGILFGGAAVALALLLALVAVFGYFALR